MKIHVGTQDVFLEGFLGVDGLGRKMLPCTGPTTTTLSKILLNIGIGVNGLLQEGSVAF